MASFNKITIVGYLGRDPEMRYTGQGTAVCNFSLATTEKRRNQHGETEEITTWFRVTTWGRQAELCSTYLTKGSPVYIEGRLRQEAFTDREGQQRYSLEVNATEFQFLGKKSDNGGEEREERTGAGAPARSQARTQSQSAAAPHPEDDDIPF